MPKELRALLHERYAVWLEDQRVERGGNDEILGYHLEQAYKLHAELGPADAHAQRLARRAAELLASGGQMGRLRGDVHAAENLLTRATSLLGRDDPLRVRLLLFLVEVFEEAGEPSSRNRVLRESLQDARKLGNRGLEIASLLWEIYASAEHDPKFDREAGLREAERLAAELEEIGQEEGLARAWNVVGRLRSIVGQAASAEDAFACARDHAFGAGDKFIESWILVDWAAAKLIGPAPTPEAIVFAEDLLRRAGEMPRLGIYARAFLAPLYALRGRFEEARTMFTQAGILAEQLGQQGLLAWQPLNEADIELRAGAAESAERKARLAIERLNTSGDPINRTYASALLADALYRQGRFEEADLSLRPAAAETAYLGEEIPMRSVEAKLRAADGDHAEAGRLAREAVALADQTDWLLTQGDTRLDLAEVLRLAGRPAEAIPYVEQAIDLYERKQATFCAEQARALLDRLETVAGTPA